jgi:ribosomal protein S18 acetylase RimI-like enzyme
MGRFKPELQQWWGTQVGSLFPNTNKSVKMDPFQFLPQYSLFVSERLGEGVKQNNWHLQTLATHPDYQRHGVARALIEAVAEKVIESLYRLC